MNKIEVIKTERDGLAVKEMIAHYASTGWESIPKDDVQRLKMKTADPDPVPVRIRFSPLWPVYSWTSRSRSRTESADPVGPRNRELRSRSWSPRLRPRLLRDRMAHRRPYGEHDQHRREVWS